MRLRLLRMITLMCTALTVGLTFAHVLELPQKMDYGYLRYEQIQHDLYLYYAYVGAPLEVLAIVFAIVLAVRVRRRDRQAFAWTLTGAAFLVVGLAEWALVVQTANDKLADWAPSHAPADWTAIRNQWEYGHVGHFALLVIGFVLLLWSSLRTKEGG